MKLILGTTCAPVLKRLSSDYTNRLGSVEPNCPIILSTIVAPGLPPLNCILRYPLSAIFYLLLDQYYQSHKDSYWRYR